ncbi:MAG: sulfite exporter TauE/SafE family protein [Bacilli bacterium]|nr:sulfite exporter TauE/SafE family protein [Bacilli bacterium]
MSLYEILFILVIFLSNIVQTVTGFAGTVLAMPFSIELVGEAVAKPVLNVVAIGVCLFIVIMHFKEIDWKLFLKMIVFIGIGFAAGIGLSYLPHDARLFLKIYGAVVVAIGVLFLIIPPERMKLPDWALYTILVLGGVLHALYISGGPLVIIFATIKIKDKHAFRATLSAIWVVLNSILLGQQGMNGMLTAQVGWLILIGGGVTLASIIIGHFLAKYMPKKAFMIATYILLIVSGVTLLIK